MIYDAFMTVGKRILEARTAKRLSQNQLAKALGISRNSVSQWESGTTYPKPDNIDAAAKFLGVSSAWLTHGEETATKYSTNTIQTQTVPIIGTASAGVFLRPDMSDIEITDREIMVVANHRFPHARRFAVKVVGSSMNRSFLPGDYAICVAWEDIGKEYADGDVVFVERTRAGEVEYTVKMVRVIDGRVELWPDSNDDRWQERILLESKEDDTEVRVKGLVISRHKDF